MGVTSKFELFRARSILISHHIYYAHRTIYLVLLLLLLLLQSGTPLGLPRGNGAMGRLSLQGTTRFAGPIQVSWQVMCG
jgi:hypothetical protein